MARTRFSRLPARHTRQGNREPRRDRPCPRCRQRRGPGRAGTLRNDTACRLAGLEDSMTTEYSSAQLMGFAELGMLDKTAMADLLEEDQRSAFLAACAEVEREFTRVCAAHGD